MIAIVELTREVESFLQRMNLLAEGEQAHLKLLKFGSTVVMLSLAEKGEGASCQFTCIVLKECTPTPQLLEMILELNQDVLVGSFFLSQDDTLTYSATLPGEGLTFDDFEKTLNYVAKVADDYDDPLQEVAGGLRAQDLLEQTES
jgi:hypothetical protein